MSLSDKDIDTLFQRMDEKASVKYKDAYWTEMQQLLNVQERKRGFVWWLNGWVLIPAGLLLATVTAMGFSMRKPSISTEIVKNTSFVTDVDRVAQENDTQLVNFYRPTSDKLTSRSSVTAEKSEMLTKADVKKVISNTFNSSKKSEIKMKEVNELPTVKSQLNDANVLVDTRKVSSSNSTAVKTTELETPSLDTPIERMNGATLEKDTMPNQGDAILQTDAITEKTNTENMLPQFIWRISIKTISPTDNKVHISLQVLKAQKYSNYLMNLPTPLDLQSCGNSKQHIFFYNLPSVFNY